MSRDGSQYLNAHVFPGGQIEACDRGNLRKAALRELYEEASIHLLPDSHTTHPTRVIPQAVTVDTSNTPYSQFLKSASTTTAEENLIPYTRWITPRMMPKRFDTTFFLALAKTTDAPINGKIDGQEIKSLSWLSPSDALILFSQGKITLFPPQWYDSRD